MGQDPNAYASYLYGKVGGLVAVYLVVLILGFFLSLVVNKFMLDTFDNKRANFAESFNGSLRLFVPYLKTTLLFIPAYVVFLLFFWVVSVVVTMLFGFTLGHVSQALSAVVSYLVICVVILYVILRFSFVFLATLDGAGPSDSFRHSFRITKGNVLVLFLISFVCGVLGCVGMLCLFIGFFPAIAFGGLFMCSAYRHMSPKDGAELEEVEGKKNELGDQIM